MSKPTPPTPAALPQWPDVSDAKFTRSNMDAIIGTDDAYLEWQDEKEFYHANYLAAMARLRVAVGALRRAYDWMEVLPSSIQFDMLRDGDADAMGEIQQALALIGPLPELPAEVG